MTAVTTNNMDPRLRGDDKLKKTDTVPVAVAAVVVVVVVAVAVVVAVVAVGRFLITARKRH